MWHTTKSRSATITKEKLIRSGTIIPNIVKASVPDMADIDVSILPKVSSSSVEAIQRISNDEDNPVVHLIIKLKDKALQSCLRTFTSYTVRAYLKLTDMEHQMTLQRRPFECKIDKTGLRVFMFDLASQKQIEKFNNDNLMLDCEICLLPCSY